MSCMSCSDLHSMAFSTYTSKAGVVFGCHLNSRHRGSHRIGHLKMPRSNFVLQRRYKSTEWGTAEVYQLLFSSLMSALETAPTTNPSQLPKKKKAPDGHSWCLISLYLSRKANSLNAAELLAVICCGSSISSEQPKSQLVKPVHQKRWKTRLHSPCGSSFHSVRPACRSLMEALGLPDSQGLKSIGNSHCMKKCKRMMSKSLTVTRFWKQVTVFQQNRIHDSMWKNRSWNDAKFDHQCSRPN